MKKLISMAMVMALMVVMSVTVFAAGKADLQAKVDANTANLGMTAAQIAEVKAVIDNLSDEAAAAVDVNAVAAAVKPVQDKLIAGTATVADINAAVAAVNTATGLTVTLSGVSINGKGVSATASVSIPAGKSSTGAVIVKDVKVSAGASTETVTSNPIKATGTNADMTKVSLLALAVIAVLGTAVVVTRKLGLAE